MRQVQISTDLKKWFDREGKHLQDVLECWGPDDVFLSALTKLRDAFLMPGNPDWPHSPCDQTHEAKEILTPFLRGETPTDLNLLRRACIIQNMNLCKSED